jgi:hypothetical protein
MAKKILSVGIDVPGDQATYASIRSKLSLLDYDISIFNPDISLFSIYAPENYQGKPCLSDSASFALIEHLEHWRREILEAIIAGQTIFLLLNRIDQVFVDTGERSYSGTGRNRITTRHVAPKDNYSLVPGGLVVTNSNGTSMKIVGKDNLLANYWAVMGDESEYRVIISGEGIRPLVITKVADKTVGAYRRYKNASGTLIFLPYVDFHRDNFTREEEEEIYWTEDALKLSSKFIGAIASVDKALREGAEITPEPDWISQRKYILPKEDQVRKELLTMEAKLKAFQEEKEKQQQLLFDATLFKWLLYEKGKRLETAIIEALKILGFEASAFKDSDSEFDVVFECSEGRVIGEAEGKDNKPINIDKLRQLEMNVHEDFSRPEVEQPAKGALIGNAYRITDPATRTDFFTDKW